MDFITTDEAVAALRGSARIPQVATCGHTGCTDHQADDSPVVHVRSRTGDADWTVDNAAQFVTAADQVAWAEGNHSGHDLAVMSGGSLYLFDVQRAA